MANFTKNDLLYPGYKDAAWPTDDPHLTGKPDSTLLNRSESYEITYFINRYMTSKGLDKKSTFQAIEKHLKDSKHGSNSHAFWTKDLNDNF